MSRKARRATLAATRTLTAGEQAQQLFAEALAYQQQHRFDDAVRAIKRVLSLKPNHAQAHNQLACLFQAQGKLRDASARFARALTLMPELFDAFGSVCATLVSVLPALGEAMRRAAEVWPQPIPRNELFDAESLAEIIDDPLLLCILQSTPVRDFALERVLTLLRRSLLSDATAGKHFNDDVLTFSCALAKQCFINEYVFATTPEEDAQVDQIAIALDADIAPIQIAIVAMYRPLHALPDAGRLLARRRPAAIEEVVTQQLREPLQERSLRESIPRLTTIDDASSRVRQQYEENPYPRWVHAASQIEPTPIEQYLRGIFPSGPFTPRSQTDTLDVLVAGCGAGWQAVGIAQNFKGSRLLAVDLSLSSLAYAVRRTPAAVAPRIDYAQADILKLAGLERRFDLIEATGVLHHLADPLEGWRILLALLKPGGFMHIGLYSELARREVVAARNFIAERGYGATPDEIRRCRQELIDTPMRAVARFNDFFSTSECRDLLFHVQEAGFGIPAIKDFMEQSNLKFLGFEFDGVRMRQYRALFSQRGWSLTDLARWQALETAEPDTFANMYNFWAQKS